ncbi:MAG: aminotransferase class I/II-fold pyridoxal phosphate-dependent enzyme, partial [Cellulosilyticaceae bacterium]
MNKRIPLSVPNLKGNEEKYVVDAIRSGWVSTGGSYIDQFEADIAEYLKVEGAVACQSGTAGIHLALTLSGVAKDDEVIVPTLTFIAAVNPVKYVGAHPIFMDCDDNLILDIHKVKEFFKIHCRYENGKLINLKTQRQIKAIVIVHVFGNLANMEEVMQLAEQ